MLQVIAASRTIDQMTFAVIFWPLTHPSLAYGAEESSTLTVQYRRFDADFTQSGTGIVRM